MTQVISETTLNALHDYIDENNNPAETNSMPWRQSEPQHAKNGEEPVAIDEDGMAWTVVVRENMICYHVLKEPELPAYITSTVTNTRQTGKTRRA